MNFVKFLFLLVSTSDLPGKGLADFGYDDFYHDINLTAILESFMLGYDKRVRPNNGGPPVTVGVSLYVLGIEEVNTEKMDFSFDMYFRQFWTDPRMAFNRRPGFNKVVVGADYIDNLWVPDTFFVNEKSSHIHQHTTKNQFLRIMHTGEILRSIRMSVKATCPMDLHYFPMDTQLCTLEIESFGYTMSDIRFRWENGDTNSVQVSPDVSTAEFSVVGHRQRLVEASLSSGNYSRLLMDIQFRRAYETYITQIYIPVGLLVAMTWVSFWLDDGAAGARVGLCVTAIISIMAIGLHVNASLPKIAYLKAIDVYLWFCLLISFAALVEFALVSWISRIVRHLRQRQTKNDNETSPSKLVRLLEIAGRCVDWASRLIFPVAFLVFKAKYWSKYQDVNSETVDDLVTLN